MRPLSQRQQLPVPQDCVELVCDSGLCVNDTCTDKVANGSETDVDCGGPECPACGDGGACKDPSDCDSGSCESSVCQSAGCMDDVFNGDETDLDCGGSCGATCIPGQDCDSSADCVEAVCEFGQCSAPSCGDTVLNGDETDTDCGGSCGATCGTGDGCGDQADCVSGVCSGGVCAAPACGDGVDKAFEGIAAAKANAERNLQNARAVFESYLNEVFSRRGEGWEEKPLTDLCQLGRIITYGVIKLGDEVPNGVPCLRTSNVRWLDFDLEGLKRISPPLSAEFKRTILKGGEVLVNVRGTLGGVSVTTAEMAGWNVSREIAVVPVEPSRIDPGLLAYWIGTRASQEWLGTVKKGATYIGINIEDLRRLPVWAPQKSHQAQVIRDIDAFQERTKLLESLYTRKLAALEELKQSLLDQAFRGEL